MSIRSTFNSGSFSRGVFYDDVYQGLVLDGDALWDEEITGNIDTFIFVFKDLLTQSGDELILSQVTRSLQALAL